MSNLDNIRARLGESGYALSKYDEVGAWYEYARGIVEHFERQGYCALNASLCFAAWGGGVKHYVSKEQAHTVAKSFFSELEKLTGIRNGRKIDRLVFEQAGSSNENIHYHIVIFVPKNWAGDIIGKYGAAVRKTKDKALKADSEYKGILKASDVHGRLDAVASICEVANDGSGMASAIYAGHELRQRQDSFSTEFSSVTKR